METKKSPWSLNEWLPTKGLRFLILAVLILGIFFRFAHLDQKAYWYDETFTSLQLSGYRPDEIAQKMIDGRVISITELQKYQYPTPEKNVFDTIKGVAEIEPQLTPLYFGLLRFWVQLFGNSIAIIRSFSAVLSLLAFPAIFWLCWELFQSPLIGWLAVVFIAVSPFHILYAQEARPYSLWTVTILLSSAALLRAMRRKTPLSWATYSLTVILGLYSFLFSILVYISHGIYVLLKEHFRFTKTAIHYLMASFIGFLCFAPWIYIVTVSVNKIATKEDWRSQSISLVSYIIGWIRSISLFFIDFNLNPQSPLVYFVPFALLLLGVLMLVTYILYEFEKNAPKDSRNFVLSLIATPALILILSDLILGGQRSLVTRYLIPSFLGIQLAVAYWSGEYMSGLAGKWPGFKKVAIITLLSLGILSGVVYTNSQTWWTKSEDNIHHELATIINQASQPLLVSDTWFVRVLSLSHQLDPKVQLQLITEPNIPKIASGFSDIFLYQPSQNLQDSLKKDYNLNLIHASSLWQLTKK